MDPNNTTKLLGDFNARAGVDLDTHYRSLSLAIVSGS
jgi:hypothetical protein